MKGLEVGRCKLSLCNFSFDKPSLRKRLLVSRFQHFQGGWLTGSRQQGGAAARDPVQKGDSMGVRCPRLDWGISAAVGFVRSNKRKPAAYIQPYCAIHQRQSVIGTDQHSGELMVAAPVQFSVSLQHLSPAGWTKSQMLRRPDCAVHNSEAPSQARCVASY
jgi:hypothetical protein